MNNEKIYHSKIFKIACAVIIQLIIILLAFRAGTFVGFRKAGFSYNWGDNYHMNFGGPRRGFMGMWDDKDLIDSNGVAGIILTVSGDEITVKGRDNAEKIITINDKTTIKKFKDDVKITDLKSGDFIVSIGEPDSSGKITGKLIRVMPTPPDKPLNGQIPDNNFPPMPAPMPLEGNIQPPDSSK